MREIFEKYINIISKCLKVPVNFEIDRSVKGGYNCVSLGYSDFSEENTKGMPEHLHINLETDKEDFISSFTLTPFPGCCAFCISHNSFISLNYRNKGLQTILNKMRQEIVKYYGYTGIICTDIETNIPQRRVLYKNKWKDIYNVVNKRTNNKVFISIKEL